MYYVGAFLNFYRSIALNNGIEKIVTCGGKVTGNGSLLLSLTNVANMLVHITKLQYMAFLP